MRGVSGLPGPLSVTGDYRHLRARDMSRVAWLVGRAFVTRLPPWIPGRVWNVLLWPARLMVLAVVWTLGGIVLVAPAAGPPRASVALAPPLSWSRELAVRWLATLTPLVVTMIVLMLVAGFGVVAAIAAMEGLLLVVDQRLTVRSRPPGDSRPPSADVTVGQLAAWPMGQGYGPALMGAALADMDGSWPGAILCLQPANERVVMLYEGMGYRFAPGSGWMVRRCGAEHHLTAHRQDR